MEDKIPTVWSFIKRHREFIMYFIFGLLTTFVNWLIYSLCVRTLGLDLYSSGIIAWIIAVSTAFITNKIWVFKSCGWKALQLIREAFTFFGGRLLTGVLEVAAVPALVSWGFNQTLFGVEGLPAKIIVSFVIVILNYIISKFLSFGGGKNKG
ncbi:MAG: GtrA family protein [Clostridiales bacterium]|nr:GtrA family protein [Clostridiales bacterium]